NPEVIRYIGDGEPWSLERAREFVERQMRHYSERQYCLWKMSIKDTGEFAGFSGIQPLVESDDVEIGWWLAQKFCREGLPSAARGEVLRDAFGRVGLRRVVSVALPENVRSTRIMEKLGMKFEKEKAHKGFNVVMYSIEKT